MNVRVSMVAGIVAVLFLAGCGGILIRPAADKVQKVALISAYMNLDFYNVEDPGAGDGNSALRLLGKTALKDTKVMKKIGGQYEKEYEALIAHGVDEYVRQLDGLGNWQWLPAATITADPAYQEFVASLNTASGSFGWAREASAAVASSQWQTARGMARIPLEQVTGNRFAKTADGAEQGQASMRKTLAELCRKLDVDAVAILELDMAYKKPLVRIEVVRDERGVPSMSAALVVVNRDGQVAVNSGLIERGKGKRFTADTVKMLSLELVRLDDAVVNSYCKAIDRSAADMRARLTKAFSKLKS